MFTFLIVLCVIETIWIIGGIGVCMLFISDDDRLKKILKEVSEEQDVSPIHICAGMCALWLPLGIWVGCSILKDKITGK